MKRIIKKIFLILGVFLTIFLLVFFAGVLWPLDVPEAVTAPDRLVIQNVTVVDVEGGAVRPGMDVLIEGGEITAVEPDINVQEAVVISGEGQYLIPGLFDMHVHSIAMSPVLTHPLFVAAGVTAVRDMGGCLGEDDPWVACVDGKREWNQAVAANRMVGPRYDLVTGLAINGGKEIPGSFDPALGAATPEGARARVQHDRARGIDFLKPYTRLPREGYMALAEAASEQGMYLAGHQPFAVSGPELVEAGQRSVEHAFLFLWECWPGMDDLRAEGTLEQAFSIDNRERMIREHDPLRCQQLHTLMADHGTAFVPTHTTRKLDAYALDEAYRNDDRLRFIPRPLRFLWLEDANAMAQRAGDGQQDAYMQTYRFGLEQTGAASRGGVTILAGTDAPDSFAFPGSGLHDELEHLVEAGLSEAQALRAATSDAAQFMGLEGHAGVVDPGARADLVMLSANPLQDISAVRQITTVILAGGVYTQEDLETLKAGVEAAAGHWSMWPKFAWQMLTSPVMRKQLID